MTSQFLLPVFLLLYFRTFLKFLKEFSGLSSCLIFDFQGSLAARSSGDPHILPLKIQFCQHLFLLFLSIFRGLFPGYLKPGVLLANQLFSCSKEALIKTSLP